MPKFVEHSIKISCITVPVFHDLSPAGCLDQLLKLFFLQLTSTMRWQGGKVKWGEEEHCNVRFYRWNLSELSACLNMCSCCSQWNHSDCMWSIKIWLKPFYYTHITIPTSKPVLFSWFSIINENTNTSVSFHQTWRKTTLPSNVCIKSCLAASEIV